MNKLNTWRLFSAMMALVLIASLGAAVLPASPVQAASTPMVAAGGGFTVGLQSYGNVVAVGANDYGQCDVGTWTGITQVAAGDRHTVGLKADGTVVAVGHNANGQLNVSSWAGITQVAAGLGHTIGVESGGTVVAVGYDQNGSVSGLGSWTNIIQVDGGLDHTVGLKSNGTVLAAGDNTTGQCNVSSWTEITQVAAGCYHTVGLKSDGTVLAAGDNTSGQLAVGSWTGIIQVAAGNNHTVGLKSDGTVVAVGGDASGQVSGVSSWTGITQVTAGTFFTVGLKSDGTVVATGNNSYGQCNVDNWNLAFPPIPAVVGDYSIKGSIKFFDWKCNKWIVVQSGTLHITEQYEHKVKGYFEPGVTIKGWPASVPVEGYVGPFERDAKLKIKNKPRLSLVAELGTYCEYPSPTYVTYILNGNIKWDKKTDTVKSIKCTINGWGEFSTAFPDASPSVGQFEGKFTATPMP